MTSVRTMEASKSNKGANTWEQMLMEAGNSEGQMDPDCLKRLLADGDRRVDAPKGEAIHRLASLASLFLKQPPTDALILTMYLKLVVETSSSVPLVCPPDELSAILSAVQLGLSRQQGGAPQGKSCTYGMQAISHLIQENGPSLSPPQVDTILEQLLPFCQGSTSPSFSTSVGANTPRNRARGRSWSSGAVDEAAFEDPLEVQRLAFVALGALFAKAGPQLSATNCTQTLEVLAKRLDAATAPGAPGRLAEDLASTRLFAALLRCLQLVLAHEKTSLESLVPSLIPPLRQFFVYGLSKRPGIASPGYRSSQSWHRTASHDSIPSSNPASPAPSNNLAQAFDALEVTSSVETSGDRKRDEGAGPGPGSTSKKSAYVPPHLRKSQPGQLPVLPVDPGPTPPRAAAAPRVSARPVSVIPVSSSESEQSDGSDGIDGDRNKASKVRLEALSCVTAIARRDPKALHSQWAALLPTHGALLTRPPVPNLLNTLISDPLPKARLAAVAALVAMLEGPTKAFLQAAEWKDDSRSGPFLSLSATLGLSLNQCHVALLQSVATERSAQVLAAAFKALALLISASPYHRLPETLLPDTIRQIERKTRALLANQFAAESAGAGAAAVACLGAALGTASPVAKVADLLSTRPPDTQLQAASNWTPQPHQNPPLSKFFSNSGLQPQSSPIRNSDSNPDPTPYPDLDSNRNPNPNPASVSPLLSFLIAHCQPPTAPAIALEAYAALRETLRNYGAQLGDVWPALSALLAAAFGGSSAGGSDDRLVLGGVRVLDEYLRSISGASAESSDSGIGSQNGAGLASAPKRADVAGRDSGGGLRVPEVESKSVAVVPAASAAWKEVLSRHVASLLTHQAPMVRSATLGCLAGLSGPVFDSFDAQQKNLVVQSIARASEDAVPAVRSAACRAAGVAIAFPFVPDRHLLTEAILRGVSDSVVSVRILAVWALANLCETLSQTRDGTKSNPQVSPDALKPLADAALEAARDGDKVRANAVRTLGNLAAAVDLSHVAGSQGDTWIDRMVAALLTCTTTGNVKVQWNVCHALAHLLGNASVELSAARWAPSVYSVLLLLLRTSTNFKIRIQAAAALAVPKTRKDYGDSFPDIVRCFAATCETVESDHGNSPSDFKYRSNLQQQVAATLLHVLACAEPHDFSALRDPLIKRQAFLQEFVGSAWASVTTSDGSETGLLSEAEPFPVAPERATSDATWQKPPRRSAMDLDEQPLPLPKRGPASRSGFATGGHGHRPVLYGLRDVRFAAGALRNLYDQNDQEEAASAYALYVLPG